MAIGHQSFYQTQLTSGISDTDLVIPVDNVPTPSEGFLVIEGTVEAKREIIYYTSKGASSVTVPSGAGNGRGYDGTTAVSHLQGAAVVMAPVGAMFDKLGDATFNSVTVKGTDIETIRSETTFDFIASGGVWSGDAYASTRNASMTALVCYINGRRGTISAVTARSFTASKDTYVDVLNNSGTFSLVYTEVTNNAASPALAANSIRLAIIVTGASNIAAAGSVNQGQEDKILPIASSIAYTTTDSLGNLICPRDPSRKILGYRQIIANFSTASTSPVQVTGLSVPVIVPTGRKVSIKFFASNTYNTAGGADTVYGVWDGTVGTILVQKALTTSPAINYRFKADIDRTITPTSASKTYNVSFYVGAGTGTMENAADAPGFIRVELA